MRLWKVMEAYAKDGRAPFHMPGHKRRAPFALPDPYTVDFTEIDGLDDLHHPEGVLKEDMEEAARIYHTRRTFFLTGGSTCGILAAVCAAAGPGEKVLIARNCHRSVLNACLIGDLEPVWLDPETVEGTGLCGSVTPESVREALRAQPEIRAVVITSPSYEGVVSDIAGIARAAREAGAVLITDEAHGAHLSFGDGTRAEHTMRLEEAYAGAGWCGVIPAQRKTVFPASAAALGSDLTVQSLHKTLPALTGAALLHVGADCPVDPEDLRRWLSVTETSSPSYVILASVCQCLDYMRENGEEEMRRYGARLTDLRARLLREGLPLLTGREPGIFAYDPGKLWLTCPGRGEETAARLREDGVEPEMASADGVLLMTSPADKEKDLDALAEVLLRVEKKTAAPPRPGRPLPKMGERRLPMKAALRADAEAVSIGEAAGRTAAETAYLYPPGIPVTAAGAEIPREAVDYMNYQMSCGARLKGTADPRGERIRVLKE